MGLNKSVDNLCIYDVNFSHFAERFIEKLGGSSAVHAVDKMSDLDAALNEYNGVKFLEIALHGSPGMLYLNDKTTIVGSYINKMVKNPLFLTKGARILFDNCSIGASECGDKFMNSVGAGMLKGKGGIVGATTVDNLVIPIAAWADVYLLPFTDGRLKVRKYDESGNLVASKTVDRHGVSH